MYIKKPILLVMVLLIFGLFFYILVENKVTLASDQATSGAIYMNLQSTQPITEKKQTFTEISDKGWQTFEATAYCTFGITRTGVWVQRGIIAVDPSVIPLGSIIEIQAGPYSGLYTAMDTGAAIKGHIIDIYMPSYEEAIRFGRQKIKLKIIRKGWNPGITVNGALADGIRVEH